MARDPTGMTGKVVGGYRLGEVRGKGAASTVYEAEHSASGRRVAVRVYSADFGKDKNAASRLVAEVQKATAIKHPHLCEVLEVGTVEHKGKRHLYIATERLAGQSLRQRLANGRPLALSQALQIASDVGSALQAIHRQGGAHLSLSAGTVYLCEPEMADGDETVRLLDLGTATVLAAERGEKAPAGDKQDDIRALAGLLQQVLGGQAEGGAGGQPLLPLRLRNLEVPVHVDAAIQRALGKLEGPEAGAAGAARTGGGGFASAADFVSALLGTGSVQPAFGPWSESGSTVPVRGRSGISMLWVVGALAVVGGVTLWLHGRETGPTPQVPAAMDLARAPNPAADLAATPDQAAAPDLQRQPDLAAAPDLKAEEAVPPAKKRPHRSGPPIPPVRGPLDYNPNAKVGQPAPAPAEAPAKTEAPSKVEAPAAEVPKAVSHPPRPKRTGPRIPPLRLSRP